MCVGRSNLFIFLAWKLAIHIQKCPDIDPESRRCTMWQWYYSVDSTLDALDILQAHTTFCISLCLRHCRSIPLLWKQTKPTWLPNRDTTTTVYRAPSKTAFLNYQQESPRAISYLYTKRKPFTISNNSSSHHFGWVSGLWIRNGSFYIVKVVL